MAERWATLRSWMLGEEGRVVVVVLEIEVRGRRSEVGDQELEVRDLPFII